MYSAPLHDGGVLPHQKEREEWVRRLRERQAQREAAQTPCDPPPAPPRRPHIPELSGDAALVGLILFLLSDRTKSDGLILFILAYLLLN